MGREGEILRAARASADLSPHEMAGLVGIEPAELERLEGGVDTPSTDLLDRFARVFGVSLRRFLAGGAADAPAAVLFRHLHSEGPSFADLVETRACSVLGEFLRCAADVAELCELLGERDEALAGALGDLPLHPPIAGPGLHRQAEQLALEVRRRLGLGVEPVASMVELTRDVLPRDHPDREAAQPGLRGGRLTDLVARALSEGRIGKVRAREYLALSLRDPLPPHARLSGEQRAPVHSPEHAARLRAHRYLSEHAEFVGCYAGRVTREGERFRVEVEQVIEQGSSAPLVRGYLMLSPGFEILEGLSASCN